MPAGRIGEWRWEYFSRMEAELVLRIYDILEKEVAAK